MEQNKSETNPSLLDDSVNVNTDINSNGNTGASQGSNTESTTFNNSANPSMIVFGTTSMSYFIPESNHLQPPRPLTRNVLYRARNESHARFAPYTRVASFPAPMRMHAYATQRRLRNAHFMNLTQPPSPRIIDSSCVFSYNKFAERSNRTGTNIALPTATPQENTTTRPAMLVLPPQILDSSPISLSPPPQPMQNDSANTSDTITDDGALGE